MRGLSVWSTTVLAAIPSSSARRRGPIPIRWASMVMLAAGITACGDSDIPTDSGDGPETKLASRKVLWVNSTADVVDASPGDGVCRTAGGVCTLRAAIEESNALPGKNVIRVPAGTYQLAIPPKPAEDQGGSSIEITGPLLLMGAGMAKTIIDGSLLREQGDPSAVSQNIKVVGTAGNVTITKLTVENGGNRSGIRCPGGNLSIDAGATVVLRKVAVLGGANFCEAGGIINDGTLTLDQSIVSHNIGDAVGGIQNRGTLKIERTTISYNFGSDAVGAIASDGPLTVTNSTLSGNHSSYGPSAIVNSGAAVLNNVTITNNLGGTFPGFMPVLWTTEGTGAVTEVSNTIIAGNADFTCSGRLTSHGYNLLGDTNASEFAGPCTVVGDQTGNLVGLAPALGPLQSNGGPTPTHALLAESPAHDAGNPATPGSLPSACGTSDQRLFPRGATRCDIGAVEMQ